MIRDVCVPRLTSILDIDDRAMLIFDGEGTLAYANREASRLLNAGIDELIGRTPDNFAANLKWAHLVLPLRAAFDGREFDGQVRAMYDSSIWQIRSWPLEEGIACQIMCHHGEALTTGAPRHYDSLTALPNRHAFFRRLSLRLEQARQNVQTFTVAYFDLDRFKWLNDTLGHSAGDSLLIACVRRLVQALPEHSLVARLGGDEFAVALPLGMGEPASVNILSNILIELKQPYTISGRRIALSISAGMVSYPTVTPLSVNAGTLIDLADFALRRSKKNGRGRISVIDADAVKQFEHQRGLTKWLHDAVSCQSFDLHYQPLISTKSDRVTTVEALLRPVLGLPDVTVPEIITLAENEGLMTTLGQWIMETACGQLAAWRRSGHDININVNLAPAQLLDTTFVADTVQVLNRHRLKPSDVTFEISESLAVSDEATVTNTIGSMLANDFRLSIDDFGIEYASIGRVARLPIHQVKFDRSLISHLASPSRESKMVSGLMQLIASDDLGLSVVAEGVETDSLRNGAVAAGADLLQGFGLYRPMPADEVVHVM